MALGSSLARAQAPDDVAPDAIGVPDGMGGADESADARKKPETNDNDGAPAAAPDAGAPDTAPDASAGATPTTNTAPAAKPSPGPSNAANGETEDDVTAAPATEDGPPPLLPPDILAPVVTGGVAATTLGVTSIAGLIAVALLVDTHFNSPETIDPWVGVFVAAPIIILTGVTTTTSGIFVLKRGRGPMATGLATFGATLGGAALASGAVFGIATLLEDGFPLAQDLEPYLWSAGVAGLVVGAAAGTATAAAMGWAFAPSKGGDEGDDEDGKE